MGGDERRGLLDGVAQVKLLLDAGDGGRDFRMLREESGEALLKFSALKVTGSLTYLAGDTADYERGGDYQNHDHQGQHQTCRRALVINLLPEPAVLIMSDDRKSNGPGDRGQERKCDQANEYHRRERDQEEDYRSGVHGGRGCGFRFR